MVGGGKPKSRLEQVPRVELKDKPITLGLLIRAATEMDETNKSLDELAGKKRQQMPDLPTTEDKVRSAIGLVTYSIVHGAMKRAGVRLTDAMPGEPIPNEYLMSLAFGCFVVMGMADALNEEGVKLTLRDVSVGLVSNLLLLHTDEEKVAAYQQAASIMQGMIGSAKEHENAREWIENTRKLVLFYLAQTTEPKLKDLKALDFLGAQLKSALATAS
jgi:hypothetical protein